MLGQAFSYLITTIGGLFAIALLLRFMLQMARAPARNQLSEFLAAITNFAVLPARRVIPGWWGFDMATLFLAWLTEFAQIWIVLTVKGYETGHAVGIALAAIAALAVVQLAKLAMYIIMAAVIIQAVLSWIGNPAPLLSTFTQPFLRPLQRRVPLIANVDVTPFIVFLVCQMMLMLPLTWLENVLSRFL